MSSVFARLVCVGLWTILFSLGGQSAWGQTDERTKLIEAAKKGRKTPLVHVDQRDESKPLLDDLKSKIRSSKAKSFAPAAR